MRASSSLIWSTGGPPTRALTSVVISAYYLGIATERVGPSDLAEGDKNEQVVPDHGVIRYDPVQSCVAGHAGEVRR